MPTLDNGTKWTGSFTLSKQTGTTITLSTDDNFVDKDIELTLGVQGATASANTASADVSVQSDTTGRNISDAIGAGATSQPSSGYFLKLEASGSGSSQISSEGWIGTGSLPTASTTATKYFPVDEATASASGTNTVTPSASISGSNVTLSNTNNGVSVTAQGGGLASASVTAICTQTGFAISGDTIGSITIDSGSSSTTTTASSYISGVTLNAPTSGTNTFSITVPNGSASNMITFTFNVDSNNNVTVTES